jgi:hypothetical protein
MGSLIPPPYEPRSSTKQHHERHATSGQAIQCFIRFATLHVPLTNASAGMSLLLRRRAAAHRRYWRFIAHTAHKAHMENW